MRFTTNSTNIFLICGIPYFEPTFHKVGIHKQHCINMSEGKDLFAVLGMIFLEFFFSRHKSSSLPISFSLQRLWLSMHFENSVEPTKTHEALLLLTLKKYFNTISVLQGFLTFFVSFTPSRKKKVQFTRCTITAFLILKIKVFFSLNSENLPQGVNLLPVKNPSSSNS